MMDDSIHIKIKYNDACYNNCLRNDERVKQSWFYQTITFIWDRTGKKFGIDYHITINDFIVSQDNFEKLLSNFEESPVILSVLVCLFVYFVLLIT